MLIHKERLTGSASGGALTVTTARLIGGILRSITITPATGTTTYDVEITDADEDRLYLESGAEGTLVRDLRVPVRGILTIAITAASADEAFVVVARHHEGT